MSKPRIKLPESIVAGEVFSIKTLVRHKMESGERKDFDGNIIPRKIINKFTCDFNGRTVFSCDLGSAMAANPYLKFNAKVTEAGTFKFTWVDDDGIIIEAEEEITLG